MYDPRATKLAQRLGAETVDVPVSSLSRLGRLGAMSAKGLAKRVTRRRRTSSDLPGVESTVTSVGRLKALPMKIGQLFGYADLGVPEEARALYAVLHNWSQPVPFDRIAEVLEQDLQDRALPLLKTMKSRPIAAASIGQVHRAELADGTPVAVKVRYPDIDKAIHHDSAPAALSARLMTWFNRTAQRDLFVREARARLLEECDYELEAKRQRLFADRFADHPTIVIPEVIDELSGPRVLTSRFIAGATLDEFLHADPDQAARDRAGTALFDFYYGSLFAHAVYNCDPNPGNYLFCDDGRVAVLDHGCVRTFEPEFVDTLAALTRGVEADDPSQIHRALAAVGAIAEDARYQYDYDYQAARRMLRWFYGPMLREDDSGFDVADVDPRRMLKDSDVRKLAIPAEFLFLIRMRVGIGAVLQRLGTRADWRETQHEYLAQAEQQLASLTPFAARAATFDVVLTDPGERIIELIRGLRDLLGTSVSETKALIDQTPWVVRGDLGLHKARILQEKLEALGADVELRELD